MTADEYLEFERNSLEKHEFYMGSKYSPVSILNGFSPMNQEKNKLFRFHRWISNYL
jgi:hypothetical protein